MSHRIAICALLTTLATVGAVASLADGREPADGSHSTEVAEASQAAPVPPNSPLGRGEHPRVFFSRATLPALRTRIATHARAEFQNFLGLLTQPPLPSSRDFVEDIWGAVNYAFVAALDPAEMAQLGFNVSSEINTSEKLCRKAETDVTALLPFAHKRQSHSAFNEGYPNPIFLPLIVAYDWCHAYLSADLKTKIVDGFVEKFNRDYAGRNVATIEFSNPWLLNNQNSAKIHDALGILAFYGDPYPAQSVQQQLYDAMYTLWVDRLMFEMNQYYGDGTGWHEGIGYFSQAFLSLVFGLGMVDSTLGTDLLRTTPFFTRMPTFVSAILSPHSVQNVCGNGGEPCPRYPLKYGDSGGLPTFPCRPILVVPGVLRETHPEQAGIGKWLMSQPGCTQELTRYGGRWTNGVLYEFLYGSQDVAPLEPNRTTVQATRLGLGVFSFPSRHALVTYTSMPYSMYSHADEAFGQFTIEKYGYLVLNAGNNKGGEARINAKGMNVMMNTIGIHKGADDRNLGENGQVVDPVFNERGFRARLAGRVLAERLGAELNYVFTDHGNMWSKQTADVMQREFVYVSGPVDSEYVVIFDRVRVVNPEADQKVWKIWVPSQPRFLNGSVATPRLGKWSSSSADTLEVTNERNDLRTKGYESAPTHGRLFLRTLSPDDRIVNAMGGPGQEFQSGNDDGATPWGAPEMTDAMRAYLGWGRIEVRPSAARPYDTFLNVMQFGDSRSLSAMTPTRKLRSSDGGSVGVHIADPQREAVVMFVEGHEQVFRSSAVTYAFDRVTTRSSHLIADLAAGDYFVTAAVAANRVTIAVSKTPGGHPVTAVAGTIKFDLDGVQIVPVRQLTAPRNLRIVPN